MIGHGWLASLYRKKRAGAIGLDNNSLEMFCRRERYWYTGPFSLRFCDKNALKKIQIKDSLNVFLNRENTVWSRVNS